MAQRDQHLPGALDQLGQFGALTAERHADRVLVELVLMREPIADHGIRLAATACATEGDVIDGTADERRLPWLRLPDNLR